MHPAAQKRQRGRAARVSLVIGQLVLLHLSVEACSSAGASTLPEDQPSSTKAAGGATSVGGDGGSTSSGGKATSGGKAGASSGTGGAQTGEGGQSQGTGGQSEGGAPGAGGMQGVGGDAFGGGGDPSSGGASGMTGVAGMAAGGSVNPGPGSCGNACGAVELCDPEHLGFDDNCNGIVDETCNCIPGQTHWCFKGDPALRGAGNCQDGVERCTEQGAYSDCIGGKHAVGDNGCTVPSGSCTDITSVPFAPVKLTKGTAGFSSDADPGSEIYAVSCPSSVAICPAIFDKSGTPTFQPLQLGEYKVTYTKSVGGVQQSCDYSIFVRGRGLRVELSWDNAGVEGPPGGAKGPDLDLYLHRPNSSAPWRLDESPDTCNYQNCRLENYVSDASTPGPTWYSDAAPPLNWSKSATTLDNSCYFAPRGLGAGWQGEDRGCHNPRLDLDNFACDATIKDPNDPSFCAPENIASDEVPAEAIYRVGVHYSGVCTQTLETHPVLTIYCGGGQVAQLGSSKANGALGPAGYSIPVTFKPEDCGKKFWMAADVKVVKGACEMQCFVQPLYADPGSKAPYVVSSDEASVTFGPTQSTF